MPPGEIRTYHLSRRAAADPRLWTRGYWDRQINLFKDRNFQFLSLFIIFLLSILIQFRPSETQWNRRFPEYILCGHSKSSRYRPRECVATTYKRFNDKALDCNTNRSVVRPSYTGCPRRNVPDFGRVFLMLKYTDITQNTYVQSWTVTEIMARGVWNFDSCYTLVDYQIHIKTGRNMWFL